jgi:CheY-like chemotaxis protein
MENKKCVFICDDDQAILEACSIILREKYRVETAENCEDIINKIKEARPDIILMDIMIPGGGAEAVETIRQSEETRKIPVVVFSALNEVQEISRRLKADGVISKPFDISTLMKIVDGNIL